MWTVNQGVIGTKWVDTPDYMNLESDSSKRSDIQKIRDAEWEEAEQNKHELEELQRKDKRMRLESWARRNPEEAKKQQSYLSQGLTKMSSNLKYYAGYDTTEQKK